MYKKRENKDANELEKNKIHMKDLEIKLNQSIEELATLKEQLAKPVPKPRKSVSELNKTKKLEQDLAQSNARNEELLKEVHDSSIEIKRLQESSSK